MKTSRKANNRRRVGTKGLRGSRAQQEMRDVSSDGVLEALPVDERLAVDEALALEQAPLRSAKSVYEHFRLSARYGVAWEAFEEHARRVRRNHTLSHFERLANTLPVKASKADREGPFDRMAIRLASKICTVLNEKEEVGITELARLSSSAASLRRAASSAETDRLRRELLAVKLTERVDEAKAKGEIGPHLSARLRRAIREIYGLEMPDGRKA